MTGQLKTFSGDNLHKKQLEPKTTVLSKEQEDQLVKYVTDMDTVFFGLTINDIQRIVFQFVVKNNISHPFNLVTGLAGRDSVEGFLKRNPSLSLRKPQGVALNSVYGLNRESITTYFDNLEELLTTYKFQPHQIYN